MSIGAIFVETGSIAGGRAPVVRQALSIGAAGPSVSAEGWPMAGAVRGRRQCVFRRAAATHNAPRLHRKSTLWEGGLRVPLLLRWPARLEAGTISSQVGITMDLTASILAARVTPPANSRPEGIDLVAQLQKGTSVERMLFWRLPPAATGTPPFLQRALRRAHWKYIDDNGQYLLFDLRTDPIERHDVAHQHADLIREFRSLVAKWEGDVDGEAKQRPMMNGSAR